MSIIIHFPQFPIQLTIPPYTLNTPQCHPNPTEAQSTTSQAFGQLTCAEAHALVTLGELDVEVCDEGLDVVVAAHLEAEGRREGQLLLGDGGQVNLLQEARVGNHLPDVRGHTTRSKDADGGGQRPGEVSGGLGIGTIPGHIRHCFQEPTAKFSHFARLSKIFY